MKNSSSFSSSLDEKKKRKHSFQVSVSFISFLIFNKKSSVSLFCPMINSIHVQRHVYFFVFFAIEKKTSGWEDEEFHFNHLSFSISSDTKISHCPLQVKFDAVICQSYFSYLQSVSQSVSSLFFFFLSFSFTNVIIVVKR